MIKLLTKFIYGMPNATIPIEAHAHWRIKNGRAGGRKWCRTPLVKSICRRGQRGGPQNSRSGQGGYSTEIPVAVLGAKYKWARGVGLI
jgi:hypothetical protein